MMTADIVQLAPAGRSRHWPVLIPRTLFTRWQHVLGRRATLVWMNLYEMAETGAVAEYVSIAAALATRMGLSQEETEAAARTLEENGLLRRTGSRWIVLWPPEDEQPAEGGEARTATATPSPVHPGAFAGMSDPSDTAPVAEPVALEDGGAGGAAVTAAELAAAAPVSSSADAVEWNSDAAELQAVAQFYEQRIGSMGPSHYEKLRFWLEDKGMSSDVVALAIEETVQSAPTPRLAYVEGVLKNWYNAGVRTLADLQKSKRARSQVVPPTSEGAPNAAAFEAVDRDAVRRWREMYADEYDD